MLIDDWCLANDLGFIFAARGLGKTWLAMHLAHGMATRHDVGPWKIHGESRVLYVDGEMAAVDIKFRDHALGEPTENLVYINHELLFERTGAIMNLADYSFQEGLLAYCIEERFTVLFLDNLSTLASGIDENKSIDWEIIRPWLLRLRRAGITVIFVHHAGRIIRCAACPNVKIRPRGLSASIRYLRRRRRVPGLIYQPIHQMARDIEPTEVLRMGICAP